jgi:hypothetical protein
MREFGGGFADLENRQFGTIRVVSFAGRSPRVRWNVQCNKCQSSWVEDHTRLTDAMSGFKCRNTACALGRVEAPRAKHNEADLDRPAPAPLPAIRKVSADYELYSRWMTQWGLVRDIASYGDWQRLSNEQRSRTMVPVIDAEKVELRKQELEAFGQGIELAERERFRIQHGEY